MRKFAMCLKLIVPLLALFTACAAYLWRIEVSKKLDDIAEGMRAIRSERALNAQRTQ